MRTFLAATALVVAALPVSAAECVTVDIVWADSTPVLSDPGQDGYGDGSIDVSTVGVFLWTQGGNISHEIPADAVGATVCADGSATFTAGEPVAYDEPVICDCDEVEYEVFFENDFRYGPR